MALQQSVGVTVSVSAGLPATHDQTGFEALTYTKLGKLSGVPPARGTRDIAKFDNLETGEEEKFPDVYRAGSGTMKVGLDDSDVGQDIVETAEGLTGDAAKLSIKMVLKSGLTYYRLAVITSYNPNNIGTGNVVEAEIGCEFEKRTIKVAAA